MLKVVYDRVLEREKLCFIMNIFSLVPPSLPECMYKYLTYPFGQFFLTHARALPAWHCLGVPSALLSGTETNDPRWTPSFLSSSATSLGPRTSWNLPPDFMYLNLHHEQV